MNYCIQIETGLRGSTSIPLSEEVYRLGSDEKCEIQIPTKAAHALTVYRRTGTIFVLNRTRLQIYLGKTPLAGGATTKWSPGTNIVLDGISLKLQSSSDKISNAPKATIVSQSPSETGVAKDVTTVGKTAPRPTEGQTKSQRSQVLVIAACLMIIGMMLSLGKPLESKNEEQLEKLAEISVSLNQIASDQNTDLQSRARAQSLLDLVAQYRVSIVVENKAYATVAKTEAQRFCESLVRGSGISNNELDGVKQLSAVLAKIE